MCGHWPYLSNNRYELRQRHTTNSRRRVNRFSNDFGKVKHEYHRHRVKYTGWPQKVSDYRESSLNRINNRQLG